MTNRASSAPVQTSNDIKTPSSLTAWFVQLSNIIIWMILFRLPNIASEIQSEWSDYCEEEYLADYGDENCSASVMTECHRDRKCGLYHEFFDEDDNFWCEEDSDCEECKCISSETPLSIFITFWVFIGIGLAVEAYRLVFLLPQFMCGSFDDTNLQLQIQRVGKQQSFQALTDTILIRLIQISNPRYYKKIIIGVYNQRMFFSFTNVFMYVLFIIHRLPMYICLMVLVGEESNNHLSLSLAGVIVLEALVIVFKVRYRNGVPAKTPSLVPAASTSAGGARAASATSATSAASVAVPAVSATQFGAQSGLQSGNANAIISSQPNGNSLQFIAPPNANVSQVTQPVQNVSD